MNNRRILPFFLILLLVVITFSSCKNDNSIIEDVEETQLSSATEFSLAKLKTLFNPDGTLNIEQNRVGHIIFDLGFNFIYPNTLSYNNGTSTVVESFENLTNIAVNMTDNLYINGISFPFQVETLINGAIIHKTINNESEFISLLESRNIIDLFNCNCTQDYNPVCVELQNVNNETFTFQFPNMCYAECEGFTENDIISCYNSSTPPLGNGTFGDCFELIYPFSLIDTNSNEITLINNEPEFYYSLFLNYNLNFIFPLNVVSDGQTNVLNNLNELNSTLINCYYINCWADCPAEYNPVCVQFEQNGETITIDYYNECYALCDGFTEEDFVKCNYLSICYNCCPIINDSTCVAVNLTGIADNYFAVFKYVNSCASECAGFTQENIINCN